MCGPLPDYAVAPDEPEGTSTDFMSVTLDAASAVDGAAVTTLAGPGLTLYEQEERCLIVQPSPHEYQSHTQSR